MKLTKQMREDFVSAVMKQVPRKDQFTWSQLQDEIKLIAKECLPEEVRNCLAKYPEYFRLESNYTNKPYHKYVYLYLGQKLEDVKCEHTMLKYENSLKEQNVRNELEARIIQVANSVTTTNRLKEMLPELASFVPEDYTANKMLPTTTSGVVADLIKLGFQVSK